MIQVNFWSRVAADIEVKTIKTSDKEYQKVELFVASNRIDEDVADFLTVELWGNQALNAKKYLKKGSGVYVSGELHLDEFEKDGVKKTKVKVVDAKVVYTDKKGKEAE